LNELGVLEDETFVEHGEGGDRGSGVRGQV
jgi:hypothetical protein